MKKVSIVIPCRNERKHIEECVNRAYRSESNIDIEVLVVDGMSDDGTRDVLKGLQTTYPSLRIIDNEAQLTPFAFNLGIKESSGDYILIAGSRQFLDKGYISSCLKILDEKQDVRCVGGKLNNVYQNDISEKIARGMDSPFSVGGGNFRVLTTAQYVDTIAAPLFPKSIFNEIGFFDERLSRNQDDDFSFRIHQAGYKIYFTPEATSDYVVRASYGGLFKQYFQYGYWKVFVNKKHRAVTTLRQLVPFLWLAFLALGWIPSLFVTEFIYAYLGVIGLYLLGSIYFGAKGANNLASFFSNIWIYWIMHVAYGSGYWQGIIHFILLRRNPSDSASSLSR